MEDEVKKKRAKKAPTMQLSLEYLRAQGKVADIVERRIPITVGPEMAAKFHGRQPSKLRDLWNIFDICYIDADHRQVGFVQTTSWAGRRSHIQKMEAEAATMFSLAQVPGVVTELHAWKKDDCGKWQIKVWRTVVRNNDIPEAVLTEWAMPTLKEVRAQARERDNPPSPSRIIQDVRRIVRR